MSEEAVVRNCAPTLAGMKTGNMFRCAYASEQEMRCSMRYWNRLLSGKGLRFIPLQYSRGSALVYVYRPSMLIKDLSDTAACRLLRERGYCAGEPDKCIVHLVHRLREYGSRDDYPHEIGLFLGYPPYDVAAFIENKAQCCKCVGCWKVYGNVCAARKTFAKYQKCTEVYCRKWEQGRSVEKLTVAG